MSKDDFVVVKELMDQGKFEEARAVLRTMGRVPGIAKWWATIDRLDPARAATVRGTPRVNPQKEAFVAQWVKQERGVGGIMSVMLIVLGGFVLIFAGDMWWLAVPIALVGTGLAYFSTQRTITEQHLTALKVGQMRMYTAFFLGLGVVFSILAVANGTFYEPFAAIGNFTLAGVTFWRAEKIKQYERL
jgi:hypothetical protein